MRQLTRVVCLGTLLLLAGCSNSKWGQIRSPQPNVPVAGEAPTAATVVEMLNRNARQLQAIDCRELDLDCKQGHQAVGIQGMMACQKPHSFRLMAKAVGKDAADLGSNDQEFWYWISKAEPPYLFHCSYQDFNQGVRLPFPFQPEWIMEALGMAEYGAPENYRLKVNANTLQLDEHTTTPQGQQVTKVTLMSRSPFQVQRHVLFDAKGTEICSATITEVQQVQGVIVPKRVRLVWPSEQIELKMKLDEVTINRQRDPEQLARLFNRPNLHNVPTYDLARGPDRAVGQLQPAGGFAR